MTFFSHWRLAAAAFTIFLLLFTSRGEFFVVGEHSDSIPIVEPRLWEVKAFNYDNCAGAMMTLFAVQTTEGWPA